jgi:hypothetical protein
MKIFPSPILPVLAALIDGRGGLLDLTVAKDYLDFDLGQEVHDVLLTRDRFRCGPFWRPNPLTSLTVMPSMPDLGERVFHFLEF